MLDVSFNDIKDDGMAVISEALQDNKSLTTLGVEQCGLSVKGTVINDGISYRIKYYIKCICNFKHCKQHYC